MIPHVILDDGKDGYELEISYEEAEADITSTKPEELKKSLHAGKIPEASEQVEDSKEFIKEHHDAAMKLYQATVEEARIILEE